MKISKIPLLIFFVFLFLTCVNVQAESWKTVVGGSDGLTFQTPRKEITARNAGIVKPLNVVIIGGYDAVYLFKKKNSKFENNIINAFKGHNVIFYRGLNKEDFITAIVPADILYVSGHGGVYNDTWQSFQVASSPENKQLKNGKSLVTSLDIKNALAGNKTPKLVIFNTCYSTDLSDGVVSENRFNAAFGICANTKGKAFVGWSKWVAGKYTDEIFREILCKWARKDNQGKYLSFADSYFYNNKKCSATLIGDSSFTVVGDPKQHILVGVWSLTGKCRDFNNSREMKDASGTISFTKEGKFEISYEVIDSLGNVEDLKDNGGWVIQGNRLNVNKIKDRAYHGEVDDSSRNLTLKAGGRYDWKFQLTKK